MENCPKCFLGGLYFVVLLFLCCSSEKDEKKITLYDINEQQTLSTLQEIMYGDSSALNAPSERFKIVHISDPHISDGTVDNYATKPQNLIEAVSFANHSTAHINAMVSTGDFLLNTTETTRQTAIEYIDAFCKYFYPKSNKIPSFLCTGNHDANMLASDPKNFLSKADLHQHLFASPNYPLAQPAGENYYYADVKNPSGGFIRIIGLDNTDQEGFDYSSIQHPCFTQQQIDWLINTALKEGMTDQHAIVILNHHPFQVYSKNQQTYMCSGTHLYNEKMIPDIINAYIKRISIEKVYKTTVSPKRQITVQADFSAAQGEFVCYLGGHAHTVGQYEVPCSDPEPAKQLMFLANTLSPNMQNNTYCLTDRQSLTKTSNSFSIYAIDTQEKKIYRTYFGAYPLGFPLVESFAYQ